MSYYQGRDRRKPTGGTLHHFKEKRKFELGSAPTETSLGTGEDMKNISRSYGGNAKLRLDEAVYANVIDPKTNVAKKAKITKVKSNPSNVDYSRRGVITKGAIIETELGEARVSSRPGQDGVLNAILMK